MKAVVVREFAPFDRTNVGEMPDPQPGVGEVVIDVKSTEVNYPDLLVIAGDYQFKPPLPFSPGKVASGTIAAVGEHVTGFKIGERVSAEVEYGAYAEKLLAPAVNVFRVPGGIDFATAAALGLTYQTAHFALIERARMRSGDRVLVLGASAGVGLAAVQLAKALGAGKVIAGSRGSGKMAVAKSAGADVVVDLSMADLHDGLRNAVHAATEGRGVDVVIDPVGGDASAAALRALAWCGRIVIVGFASGKVPTLKANYLLIKNIEVSGLQWSDYRDRAPEQVRTIQSEIFRLHLAGKLNPLISRTFPLANFKEALALVRDGKAQGKLILKVAP
jgi:NADPH2:quinone reductase